MNVPLVASWMIAVFDIISQQQIFCMKNAVVAGKISEGKNQFFQIRI